MSNDFLPFAVGGSANVTPQATYAANTALTQGGFQSGIAKSPDMNKVCRQSSIMAAVLAQFIVARTGANATDDGTTATLLANLLLSSAAVNGDATKTFSVAPATQSQHAVQLQQVGHGQCRLSVTSTTVLTLKPYNGNNVIVNGVPLQLPSAGVTYTLSGLAASTLYYVYLSGNTASPVLSVSATTHVTGTNGVEVKSGDATQTLVGLVRTNASTQFVDSVTQRFCLNWFNRRTLSCQFALSSALNFTNTSSALLSSTFIVEFLNWGDESVFVIFDGFCLNNTLGNAVQLVSGADGSSNIGSPQTFNSYQANANGNFSTSFNNPLTEGYHFSSLFGNVNGGTGTLGQGSQTKATVRG